MQRIARFFSYRSRLAWVSVALVSALVGTVVLKFNQRQVSEQRLDMLQTEAMRTGIQLSSSTLHSNLMGSLALLGLLDRHIKQDASNGLLSIDAQIGVTLSSVGNAFGAEGVFVVGEDGIVKTSWDKSGKPSTGLDVRFRPYYQSAMKGQSSVYAAVSMARGDRALYMSAPVFNETAPSKAGIGAVVARTDLGRLDKLLKGSFDQALLLSPQGVVFAASRSDWIGRLEGEVTTTRLQAIRELKQFGPLFEKTDPKPLQVRVARGVQRIDGRLNAVGMAPVNWNDPAGEWTLVVLQDLEADLMAPGLLLNVGVAVLICGLLGWMWTNTLRAHRVQADAQQRLETYALAQEANAVFRERLARVSLRLQQCEHLEDLAQAFMADARELLGCMQAVLYAMPVMGSERLHRVGAYGCAEEPTATLGVGEGLLGQCALERRRMWVSSPVDGIWNLRSGLGNAPPPTLLLAPLVLHDTLIGVIEMALLKPEKDIPAEQVDEILTLLTNSLEILRRNQHTRELLDAARVQAGQLSALEERTRLVLGAVGDGIVGLDNAGLVTFSNPAAAVQLGYEPEELLGQPMHNLAHHHHADGQPFARNECPMYRTSQDGVAREIRGEVLWRKDGSSFPVEYATTPVTKEGQLVGTVVVFRDATESQRAEKALAHERQMLQTILDKSPACVAITALDSTVLFANPVAKALFGLDLGQKATAVYVHPEQRAALLTELKEKGVARDVEIEVWDRHQIQRTMLLTATFIEFESRQAVMTWQIDLTDRKAAELSHIQAKQTLDIALESAKMGTWQYHPLENRLVADAATVRLYGLEGVPLDGSMAQWFTYVDPDDAQRLADVMAHTMANRIADYRTSFRVHPPGHDVMHIMSIGRFTYNDAGQAVMGHGLVWDVTDQKKTEEELAQARHALQALSVAPGSNA